MSFSRNFSMLFDIFFLRFDLEWWGTIETNVRNISDLFIKWLLILHALRNLEPLMEWEALDYSLSSAFPVYYHDTVDSRALLVIRWIVCYQFWQSLLLCVKRTRAILLHTSECGTLWKDLNMKKDYEREARREREKDKREALCPPTLLYYQNIAWDEWVILPTSALYTYYLSQWVWRTKLSYLNFHAKYIFNITLTWFLTILSNLFQVRICLKNWD